MPLLKMSELEGKRVKSPIYFDEYPGLHEQVKPIVSHLTALLSGTEVNATNPATLVTMQNCL